MTNDAIDRSADQAARTPMRLLRFAGGDVQLAPEWPEEHPSGVTPTTLLDAFDDAPEDTDVLSPLALDEILSEVAP